MSRKEQRGVRLWVAFALLVGGSARAQDKLREVSRAEYGVELQRMAGVVDACGGRVAACDEKAVPGDETVGKGAAGEFEVHWDWLRGALKKGADAKDKDRGAALAGAAARLRQDEAALAGNLPGVEDADARRKVDEVLGRREFGQVQQTRWWARAFEMLDGKIEAWFDRLGQAVPWSGWIGLALEWGVLGLVSVALIVWALRMSKQQRVAFATVAPVAAAWQAESDDWAARAKEEAAKGEWREAVHCLYWSAIVMLEGQKLWRQNRARTPREYVGLLEAGSERRKVLGGLTGVFERIWYGIRPATSGDYEKASALLDALRVG